MAKLAVFAALVALLWSPVHAEPWRPPVTRAMVDAEFAKFDARHPALKAERAAKLRPLADRLLALQAKGEPLFCSAQMLNELRWLLDATTQWSRIDRQLWLLGVSMEDEDQAFAIGQEAYDGSWGICYDEWFKKLDPMIQAIDAMAGKGVAPEYSQLQFLQPIGSPEQLIAYLNRVRISDIANTGLDRREELGAVSTVVAEIVFKQQVEEYLAKRVQGIELDPGYVEAFRRYTDDWQDPETGFWGPWYMIDGKLLKAADLSFTYHIVAYRRGDVPDWSKIIATLLAIRNEEYPFGWRFHGRMNNHNAYDVIRLMKLGWPHMDAAQQAETAVAIEDLVRTSLRDSSRPRVCSPPTRSSPAASRTRSITACPC